MKIDATKTIGLLIVLFIIAVAVGGQDGTLSIADSEDALTGSIYNIDGSIATGSQDITSKIIMPFWITAAQAEYCAGEKLYHTFYAISVPSSDNEFLADHKELYAKLKSGVSCEIRQNIRNVDNTFSNGGWHTLSTTSFYGATAYTAGEKYMIRYIPGDYVLYIQAQCTDSTRIWSVDSKQFIVTDCAPDTPDIDDLIAACNAKDNSYCSGGYMYVKDYTYTSSGCNYQTRYDVNEVCYDEWKAEVCAGLGHGYDDVTNECTSDDPAPPVEPDDPLPPVLPPVEEPWLTENMGFVVAVSLVSVFAFALLIVFVIWRTRR